MTQPNPAALAIGFKPFNSLTDVQKAEAAAARPSWPPEELRRVEFWIKPDGHISRRSGHHRLTKEAGDAIDAELARHKSGKLAKTDLTGFRSATFHFAPEKTEKQP